MDYRYIFGIGSFSLLLNDHLIPHSAPVDWWSGKRKKRVLPVIIITVILPIIKGYGRATEEMSKNQRVSRRHCSVGANEQPAIHPTNVTKDNDQNETPCVATGHRHADRPSRQHPTAASLRNFICQVIVLAHVSFFLFCIMATAMSATFLLQ